MVGGRGAIRAALRSRDRDDGRRAGRHAADSLAFGERHSQESGSVFVDSPAMEDSALGGAVFVLTSRRFWQRKLELLLHRVHAIQAHANFVADRKLAPAALADDLARVLVIGEAIVRQS